MSVTTLDVERAPWPALRRWTVTEFERAREAGVFGPEERLELVEGLIYRKNLQSPAHAVTSGLVQDALREVFGRGYIIRSQAPLHVSGASLPEPDVYVVPGAIRDFSRQHPTSATLVIEVSDATLAFDLLTKSAMYATAGIPEYWVINIPEQRLIVYREPGPAARTYRSVVPLSSTDSVSPLEARSAVIPIA